MDLVSKLQKTALQPIGYVVVVAVLVIFITRLGADFSR